jgi:NitT/TauT family transport system ATP-binding protein
MPSPIIKLRNVNKVFGPADNRITVLSGINLEIGKGEFFVFVGPSGSGKSTLLRIMSGLEKSFKGELFLDDGQKPKTSFVFQQFALMPWLTIFENVELALMSHSLSPDERKARVNRELKTLGLQKFANAHPRDLSGGMRQRVGIARAIVGEPEIMFMDEPFSELDSFTAAELRRELLEIWEKRRMTVVMVTHIVSEAAELSDRIAVLTPRPGRIERIVANKLPRPRQNRTKEFFDMEDLVTKIIRP